MAVRVENEILHVEAHCSVEETLNLVQLLNENPKAKLDLSRCESLHSAAFQALFAARLPIVAEPSDPLLLRYVVPLLRGEGLAA